VVPKPVSDSVIGTRVWVLTDEGERVKGTVMGPREELQLIAGCWVDIYLVRCDRYTEIWPVDGARLTIMNPLDALAEIE